MRISVAMCTWNGAKFLDEQLKSIVKQSVLVDELVVCDDGSTDDTLGILRSFASTAPFVVRLYENEETIGVTKNFCEALQKCDGDIIFTCDQDDVWAPDKVERMRDVFLNDDCLLVFTNSQIVSIDGEMTSRTLWDDISFSKTEQATVNSGGAFSVLIRRNVVTGAASAVRSKLIDSALPIPQAFLHDEWLALTASLLGSLRAVEAPLVNYREHASQSVGSPIGVFGMLKAARRTMDREYFRNRVSRATAIVEFLESNKGRLVDSNLAMHSSSIITHAETVKRIHESWLARFPLVLREVLSGRYYRYDRGAEAIIRDFLL